MAAPPPGLRHHHHIPALDGLRGVAVLMVLGAHLLLTNEHPGSPVVTLLTGIRRSLWCGVDVFLVLSGFLITGILLELPGVAGLRAFYARRGLRIVPLYAAALGALGLLTLANGMPWQGYGWVLATLTQNTPWALARGVPYPLSGYSGHLWTIALEEQFYLLFPLLVLGVRSRRWLLGGLVALGVVALVSRLLLVHAGAGYELTYKLLPCRMDGFCAGGALCLLLREPRPWHRRAAALGLAAALAVLVGFGVREHGLDWRTSRFVNTWGYSLLAVAAASLVALALRPGWLARTLSTTPLRRLGRWSYGIYVWHPILAGFAVAPVRAAVAGVTGSKGVQMLAGAAAGIAVSLAAGALSFRVLELPFLRLKRFFPYPGGRVEA